MGKIAFQIMGGYVLFFAAGIIGIDLLWIGHFSPRLPKQATFADILLSLIVAAGLVLIGVGLLRIKKWAVLPFCGLTLFVAFWPFRDAMHGSPEPGEWTWLGYVFGVLLVIPSLLAAKYWESLN